LFMSLFAYVPFNFFYTGLVLNEGGVPARFDGRPALYNHGEVIRDLTEEEFPRHQAYLVRTFSGHWIVFYLGAAIMLRARLAADQREVSWDPPGPRGLVAKVEFRKHRNSSPAYATWSRREPR